MQFFLIIGFGQQPVDQHIRDGPPVHPFTFTILINLCSKKMVFSSPYVSSKTRATDPPQRVQMPLSTSIPFSIFPLTLPMPIISEQLTHHTLFNIFIRISPGMAFQIFRAWGVNENSTIPRPVLARLQAFHWLCRAPAGLAMGFFCQHR